MFSVSQKTEDAMGLKLKLIRFTLNIAGETPPLSNRKDNETLEQITKVLLKHPTQRKEKNHTVSSRTSGNCLILLIPYIYKKNCIKLTGSNIHFSRRYQGMVENFSFFPTLNICDFLFSSPHYLQHSLDFQLTLLHFYDYHSYRGCKEESPSYTLLLLQLQKHSVVK